MTPGAIADHSKDPKVLTSRLIKQKIPKRRQNIILNARAMKTCIQHSGSLTIKNLQARVKNINRINGLSIQYQNPFQV